MHSRVRVLGQPLNPLLTVLPLGILGSALLSDLGALISDTAFFARVAYWDMAAGVIAGIVTLSALLVDLITAPEESHARRVLGWVSGATAAMVVLDGCVWMVRSDHQGVGNGGLFLVELVALALGITGAWVARGLVVGRGLPLEREERGDAPSRMRAALRWLGWFSGEAWSWLRVRANRSGEVWSRLAADPRWARFRQSGFSTAIKQIRFSTAIRQSGFSTAIRQSRTWARVSESPVWPRLAAAQVRAGEALGLGWTRFAASTRRAGRAMASRARAAARELTVPAWLLRGWGASERAFVALQRRVAEYVRTPQ
ncbi:MAG TPA: DUF2231 domain-containing protein [Micromonosporaceae bacterium]